MPEILTQSSQSWISSEQLFERKPTTKREWLSSFRQAAELMGFRYSINITFRRNLANPIATKYSLALPEPFINLSPHIVFADTSLNLRNLSLAHEMSHIQTYTILKHLSGFLHCFPYLGDIILRGQERQANQYVYNQLTIVTDQDHAKTMFRNLAAEWQILNDKNQDHTKIALYMQKYMPFVS